MSKILNEVTVWKVQGIISITCTILGMVTDFRFILEDNKLLIVVFVSIAETIWAPLGCRKLIPYSGPQPLVDLFEWNDEIYVLIFHIHKRMNLIENWAFVMISMNF